MANLEKLKQFSSAEISDALDAIGVEGVLLGLKPIQAGQQIIGPAFTVGYLPYETKPASFKGAANYIDNVSSGEVIVIDNQGREDCTSWGDILTQVAIKKEIKGTLIHGACRDVASIRALGYPVYSKAITMRSGKNRVYKAKEQVPITVANITISPGDIIFADDNGALVIPKTLLDDVIEKAQNIKQTEANIVADVLAGESLAKAREKNRYDMPWLTSSRCV